jgi:hypothetical protein
VAPLGRLWRLNVQSWRVSGVWWLAMAVAAGAFGCDSEGGTEQESRPIGERDAATESDAGVPERCERDPDCDDGLFCNGGERCLPAAVGADARGCVAGAVACEAGETCLEAQDDCVLCTENDDNDQDGAKSMACQGNDCDDEDGRRFPGNAEVCDTHFDDDCDLTTVGERDLDHDGYTDFQCANAGGAKGPDCNDSNANIHPQQTEACNGVDDNCNGDTDEGLLVPLYRDEDHDEHGDRGDGGVIPAPEMGCRNEPGFAEEADDCDGANVRRHDKQLEICDHADNDCDGVIDENPSAVNWYWDDDLDGFGDPRKAPLVSCVPPADEHWVLLKRDCDDGNPDISPSAAEECDGLDNNCNGRADYRVARGNLEDDDLDGKPDVDCYGEGGDCNDLDFSVYPGAPELCDLRDNDCDGLAEAAIVDATWYIDADGDGYGKEAGSVESCGPVPDHVLRGGDCNDADPALHPGRADDCSTPHDRDDDCDGEKDEDEALEAFYVDADEDGFGVGYPLFACTQPAGYVPDQGDCAPAASGQHPEAAEVCDDGLDNDCDSYVDCDDLACAASCEVTRRLLVISGADQSAEVAAELAAPLRVRLVDLEGRGVSSYTVTLTSTGGSGPSLNASSVPTAADGSAVFTLRAGRLVGPDSVRISAPGARPITVPLTVTEPPDGQLLTLVNASKNAGSSVYMASSAPAATARVHLLQGIARARDGTLFVSDAGNNRIYRVSVQGRLEHFAGDGSVVADSVSALLTAMQPKSLVLDESDASAPKLYFADYANVPRIRVIDLRSQLVTTLAGGGNADPPDYGDGEAAAAARLWAPTDLTLVGGTLYFVDNGRIRMVDLATGIIDSLAEPANTDRDLTYCGCTWGCALTASPAGTLFVATRASGALVNDPSAFCSSDSPTAIFRLDAEGTPHHVAGRRNGFGSDGIAAVEATLPRQLVMRFDDEGHLYYAGEDFRVRRIDATTSVVRTVLGDGTSGTSGDYGSGARRVSYVNALAFDGDHLLVADSYALRALWSEGGQPVTTFTASLAGPVDARGPILSPVSALGVEVRRAEGPIASVAVNFRSLDTGGYPEQRRVATAANGRAATVPWLGRLPGVYDFEAFVEDLEGRPMFPPVRVSVEASEPAPGTVLPLVNRTRQRGTPRLVGPAQLAVPGEPRGLALGSDGTLYFATASHRVFKVTPEGEIEHVAGDGQGASRGDGLPAVNASIDSPRALALHEAENLLYVSDEADAGRIRVIHLDTGIIDTFVYNFDGIISMSVDPATGHLWLAKNTRFFSDGFWRIDAVTRSGYNVIPATGTAEGAANAFMNCSENCTAVYDPAGQRLVLAGMIGGPTFSGPGREPSIGIAAFHESTPAELLLMAGSGVIPSNAGANGGAYDVRFEPVRGIALHGSDVYFAESAGHRVRRLRAGTVETVVGGGSGGDFAPALQTRLSEPEGLVVTPDGHLIVSDTGHSEIRIVW